MPRKNANLIVLLTALPWWASALLAPLSYVIIAWLIPATLADNVFGPVVTPLLHFVGLMFAVVFALVAGVSLFQSRRKQRLLNRQNSLESIRELSWREFEELVAQAFRQEGYRVVENDTPGPDGGVDIILHKEGQRHLVQCKNWRNRQVGVRVVREIYGVLAAENAQQALVVCSGDFTADARQFAAGKPIKLIDGTALHAMIQHVRQPSANESLPSEPEISKSSENPEGLCPKCGGQLEIRMAKRGKFTGRQFLGCGSFPSCRYTQNLPGG